VNHAEDFDANAIEHPAEVPVNNDAYHGEVNHTEGFATNVIEHPHDMPDKDVDSGGENHAEEFLADVMEHTTKVPVNDADRCDAFFADLQTATVYQGHNLYCINAYPALSNHSGRTARGYAAFVHCDKNGVSNHPKDQIAAIIELALHLPEEEAMLQAPLQYRWKFPAEKWLYAIKHGVRKSIDLFGHGVSCTSGYDYGYFKGEIDEIVWFVLNSCDEVEQYREYVIHIYYLRTFEHAYLPIDLFSNFGRMFRQELEQGGVPDIQKMMATRFASWFRCHVSFHSHIVKTLGRGVLLEDGDIFLCLCFGRY
jgi:hypothetical protein